MNVFKEKLASLLEDQDISDAIVARWACKIEFSQYQDLVTQANKCVEEYKTNKETRQQCFKQHNEGAFESKLGLDDAFCNALRRYKTAAKQTRKLQDDLNEEVEVLRRDILSAPVLTILCAIRLIIHRFEDYAEGDALNVAPSILPGIISELHKYISSCSDKPNIVDVEDLHKKFVGSRRTTRSMKRVRGNLEAEDLNEKDRDYCVCQNHSR